MTLTTLYGSPLSLYTGRARSYLIKAGIPYRETLPNTADFQSKILPKMGGRQSIPVVETTEGEVIRDGAAIIDHFEAITGNAFSPKTPKQNFLSLLFDVIGGEGLLRPAMHYRWNFPAENLEFVKFHFQTFVPPHLDKVEMANKRMDQMRNAGQSFGAIPETYELVENLYTGLLAKLDAHFNDQPYLFGGKPSIGDFGLIAPLYGHLGRDPKPLGLMQSKAIRVLRWVERMNKRDSDLGECENQAEEYLPLDTIPETLIDVLKHIAIDFVPETEASCVFINDWLAQQPTLESGSIAERGVGMAQFEVQNVKVSALAQPYRFYLLERLQSHYASLTPDTKAEIDALLGACDMTDILGYTLDRKIGRADNREVWL